VKEKEPERGIIQSLLETWIMSFSSNQFSVTSYILDETFVRFINYLNFAKVANRNLEGDFKGLKYATGQTINYRLEERYLGGEGATATSEARVQVVRPLTISKQFNTMVEFSGFELTFDRARDQPYLDMMLNPRAKRLANLVEKFIATDNLQLQVYQAFGTPGVAIDRTTIFGTDAYMTELGIPEDGNRYFALPPTLAATLADDLSNVFNMTVNRGALLDGFVGHLSGFDFFKTNFLRRQIAGVGQSGGSPPTGYKLAGTVTNGPITGGNTIVVTGLVANQANAFNVGDIITVAIASNVFMINPLTYQPLAQTAQFVVTATVASDSSGNATIPVSPTIVTSGARQNISAPIPNGAQMLLAIDHNVSIAFHNQAIVFAAPPIKELKGGVDATTSYSDLYKMAMTYSLGADIRNYLQLDRIDVICGTAINPEFAVEVMS
jgi:hypothetical protein